MVKAHASYISYMSASILRGSVFTTLTLAYEESFKCNDRGKYLYVYNDHCLRFALGD